MFDITLKKEIYSTVEVAALLGVTKETVQNWTKGKGVERRLGSFRPGPKSKTIRICRADLQEFLAVHYNTDPEPVFTVRSPTSRRNDKVIQKLSEAKAEEILRRHKAIDYTPTRRSSRRSPATAQDSLTVAPSETELPSQPR